MIDLVFSGMCKGCTTPRLELDVITTETFNGDEEVHYIVECEHYEACRTWQKDRKDDYI